MSPEGTRSTSGAGGASAPACLLCGKPTRLLYPANVSSDTPIERGELACTSPFLAIHDDIFSCSDCGLARSRPPLAGHDIEDLYREVEDEAYLVSAPERRSAFREALERIHGRGFAPPGRLLEIGSAAGLFLDEARRVGWEAVGIEPSKWGAEAARALGVAVVTGTLDEFESAPGSFDVVVSWDVWEHLEDPVGALERTHELLRPGGLLVFTTVNVGGLGAKLFRGRWPWFMRMHLHYFTKKSLTGLVSRAGFEVLAVGTEPKTLKLGYVLDRARSFLGPVARLASASVRALGLEKRPVRIDLGDILRVEARKPSE